MVWLYDSRSVRSYSTHPLSLPPHALPPSAHEHDTPPAETATACTTGAEGTARGGGDSAATAPGRTAAGPGGTTAQANHREKKSDALRESEEAAHVTYSCTGFLHLYLRSTAHDFNPESGRLPLRSLRAATLAKTAGPKHTPPRRQIGTVCVAVNNNRRATSTALRPYTAPP